MIRNFFSYLGNKKLGVAGKKIGLGIFVLKSFRIFRLRKADSKEVYKNPNETYTLCTIL